MSLQTFCDIVWAEVWDDCPPMGDQTQYRDIMYRLFIKGDPPHTITYKDAKGKLRRLSDAPRADISTPVDESKLDAARRLMSQVVGERGTIHRHLQGDVE